jgi:hypothetical protein
MINVRFGILELAKRHRLDSPALASLWKLARLGEQPVMVLVWFRLGLGYLAGLLGGLGIIFLVAANWNTFGRTGQFLLFELLTLGTCVSAAFIKRARSALALLALLSIGALFAFYGQTYQTGGGSVATVRFVGRPCVPARVGGPIGCRLGRMDCRCDDWGWHMEYGTEWVVGPQ